MKKEEVYQGDYFALYDNENQEAMQVVEKWANVMVVKNKDGYITKPYSDFQKVDAAQMKHVYDAPYFEDNTTLNLIETDSSIIIENTNG